MWELKVCNLLETIHHTLRTDEQGKIPGQWILKESNEVYG